MTRLIALAVLSLTLVVPLAAQQSIPIPNSTFDSGVSGWSVDPISAGYTILGWSSSAGSPPGAAHVLNVSTPPGASSYVYSQCVAVTPSSTINFSGQILQPSGQPASRGFLVVYWYKEATCSTGSSIRGIDGPGSTTNEFDVWKTYSVDKVVVPADASGAKVGLIATKDAGGGSISMFFDNVQLVQTSAPGGPDVIATALPAPMIAAVNGTATTSYTLTNTGSASTTITLTNGGDANGAFFTQSPTSFTLAAGASQVVTIASVAQSTGGAFSGFSAVSGNGVPANYRVPVQLLVEASAPSTTTVQAVTTRVDVAAPDGSNPSGSVVFRNDSDATGIVAADVPWIIPDVTRVTLKKGEETTVPFHVDRSKQPDAENPAGSIAGKITLAYLRAGSGGTSARVALAENTGVAVSIPVTDTRQPVVRDDTVPSLASGEVALLVPGVGHVVGSGGKEFISDVSIANAQSLSAISDVKLIYAAAAKTVSTTQNFGSGQSVQLADAVKTYFAQGTASQGTLHIRAGDTSGLAVSANVFNKANPKGSYGTAIPVFRSNRAAASGEALYLTGLRRDATSHTNIYLQEVSGVAAAAHIEHFDASGALLGTNDVAVPAFGFAAVGSVVPVNGVLTIVTNTSGGRLQAYATPVDDASGDTWAVADWNRQSGATGSTASLIPVAGFAPGANGANFRTDLALTNSGSNSATASLTYYPANVTKSITLGARQTRVIEDVTQTLFGVSGTSVGSIVLTPQGGGRFAASSRIYTASAGDPATYGTSVPTVALSSALKSGESRVFGGLEDTTLDTVGKQTGNTYRTNAGLVETAGQSATVKLSLYFATGYDLASGAPNGSLTVTLAPHEFRQLNGVVRQIVGVDRDVRFGDLHNVKLKVEVLSGSLGAVVPFVTATDNGTNDTALRVE